MSEVDEGSEKCWDMRLVERSDEIFLSSRNSSELMLLIN